MINVARLHQTFLDLVKIDSLTYQEKGVVEFLCQKFAALGLKPRVDNVGSKIGGESGNLTLTLKGDLSAPPILFNAHLDTVEPGRGIIPQEEEGVFTSREDTILGADDKAGIAAISEMVFSLREAGIKHGPIEIVFTVAEEKGLLGAKNLDFSKIKAKFAFVFDSASPVGYITVSAPFQNTLNATFLGRATHAGVNPEVGINAIQAAAKAIASMPLGRIDPETTTNIGVIQGGRAANIVPDKVDVKGEARSLKEKKLERETKKMLQFLEKGARKIGAKVNIDVIREYDGFKLQPSDLVVRWAAEAIKRLGVEPVYESTGGGSDTNIFNARGLPAVGLGVGYLHPHSTSESISLDQLTKAAELAIAIVEVVAR